MYLRPIWLCEINSIVFNWKALDGFREHSDCFANFCDQGQILQFHCFWSSAIVWTLTINKTVEPGYFMVAPYIYDAIAYFLAWPTNLLPTLSCVCFWRKPWPLLLLWFNYEPNFSLFIAIDPCQTNNQTCPKNSRCNYLGPGMVGTWYDREIILSTCKKRMCIAWHVHACMPVVAIAACVL